MFNIFFRDRIILASELSQTKGPGIRDQHDNPGAFFVSDSHSNRNRGREVSIV